MQGLLGAIVAPAEDHLRAARFPVRDAADTPDMDMELPVAPAPRDRVRPATRALCAFVTPFLLVGFVLLYFWSSAEDTGRLFAWRISPDFSSSASARWTVI